MPPNSLVQGGNLTIWRIRVEDSGYYNCTAINNVGNPAKKIVNLLVRCKLLFFSEHVFREQGNCIRPGCSCTAEGECDI